MYGGEGSVGAGQDGWGVVPAAVVVEPARGARA